MQRFERLAGHVGRAGAKEAVPVGQHAPGNVRRRLGVTREHGRQRIPYRSGIG